MIRFKKIIFLLLFSTTLFAQRISDPSLFTSDFTDSRNFDANNIILKKVTNLGDFNSATWSALNYGTLPAKRILFDAGFWITGVINNKIHSAIKFYSTNYSPGPILDGQPAIISHPEDSLKYRVYKVFKGNDPQNPDYNEWPVEFGAPVDADGYPLIYGDQLLWTAYNTYDTSTVDTNFAKDKTFGVLPIEIQQKIYGREGSQKDYENIFHNVVFLEWTIINKGTTPIDSAFIGLWSDIDFYDINSNIPAIDITRQTGYLWSGIDFAPSLGGVPPAVGLVMLYGPAVPQQDSIAIFKGKEINNYRNLPLNSFHALADDQIYDAIYGPPRNEKQVFNAARGLSNSGGIIIDTSTSRPTKFPFYGDPVNESGWLFPKDQVGNGSGFILFTGPFNLAVSDTQWVMAALVPGLGVDKKESIVKMREKIDILRSMPYDSLAFGNTPAVITDIQDKFADVPNKLTLHQNYPNPFNPATTIKFDVPQTLKGNIKISIYNILGEEIRVLADKTFTPGSHSINFNAANLSSGVYFYSIRTNNTFITRKMILIK